MSATNLSSAVIPGPTIWTQNWLGVSTADTYTSMKPSDTRNKNIKYIKCS